ncbi:uncharacterized protein LOC115592965, partial [Sparus aurata]|uniref:uncharacterized protein LOC115592965 n=1 Tax=Sparus aurata TaxID=8175 RepID=UPI0011C151A7
CRFKSFHALHLLPFPSFDLVTVTSFITHAHTVLNIRTSTIHVYLSGINLFAKLLFGSPSPSISHPQVAMLIKGLHKAEPQLAPKRLPLTVDLLARCILTLRSGYSSPFTDSTLESMFLLAFFGFLRCSEFTSASATHDPSRHATLSDISFHSHDTLRFNLKRSKTDQLGISHPIFLFRLNSYLSPYEPILAYLHQRRARHSSPLDPLFITEDGRVATRFWFHHHLRQILAKSGISPELYSGHSFRIGAATTASRQGITEHTIKVLGRWSSQAYDNYIHSHLSDIRQAHVSISAAPFGGR